MVAEIPSLQSETVMSERDPTTSSDCLRDAFQALLLGDTAGRDRLCERATALAEAEQHASAVERVLTVDFYVTRNGAAVPTLAMARAAGVIH